MKLFPGFLACLVLIGFCMMPALAADSGPVTLSGKLVCGKCKLHLTDTCQNVLQVDQDGKTINYFLTQNKVAKDFHPKICKTDGVKATVTGTVKEKDGKEVLTATKITPAT
jgi:type 1 fimbria pilin